MSLKTLIKRLPPYGFSSIIEKYFFMVGLMAAASTASEGPAIYMRSHPEPEYLFLKRLVAFLFLYFNGIASKALLIALICSFGYCNLLAPTYSLINSIPFGFKAGKSLLVNN